MTLPAEQRRGVARRVRVLLLAVCIAASVALAAPADASADVWRVSFTGSYAFNDSSSDNYTQCSTNLPPAPPDPVCLRHVGNTLQTVDAADSASVLVDTGASPYVITEPSFSGSFAFLQHRDITEDCRGSSGEIHSKSSAGDSTRTWTGGWSGGTPANFLTLVPMQRPDGSWFMPDPFLKDAFGRPLWAGADAFGAGNWVMVDTHTASGTDPACDGSSPPFSETTSSETPQTAPDGLFDSLPSGLLPTELQGDATGTTFRADFHRTISLADGPPPVVGLTTQTWDWHVTVERVSPLKVTGVSLSDIDGAPLRFLSLSRHPWLSGFTETGGTFSVEGIPGTKVTSVALQVLEGGSLVTTGELCPPQQARLPVTIPSSGKLVVSSSVSPQTGACLFRIPSSAMAGVNQTTNSTLEPRVVVKTAAGQNASASGSSVEKLVLYAGNHVRRGSRDADQGGDSWIRPSVQAVLAQIPLPRVIEFNDMSNMNGGRFPPHASHDTGADVDAWFPGYPLRNALVAKALVAQLNQPWGSSVKFIFVAFTPAFRAALRGVTLTDGRLATDVLRDDPSHTDHYHYRFIP